MTFAPQHCTAVIVTHKRPAFLQHTLDCLVQTSAINPIIIIQNHPQAFDGVTVPGGRDYRRVETGRPPAHVGNLAQSWNLGWLWAWEPTTEWVLCLQDDVHLEHGWIDVIQSRPLYHLYMAPAGDQVFLLDRECLRRVGWFDERFTTIGFQEWDYVARALRAFGPAGVSLEDDHGWKHNPIGLAGYWRPAANRPGKDESHIGLNDALMHAKWGHVRDGMKRVINSGAPPPPMLEEIEWYPWFVR